MDTEMEKVLDRTKIIETINRLFIGTDNRDWELVKSCFAQNVLFDMSSLGGGNPAEMTPDAIVAAWDSGLKPLKAIHHQAGNYLVDIEGTEAEAFCYAEAHHYLPNKSGRNTRTFVGSYEIGLFKEGDRWRISRFKFNLKYLDGNPDLERS
ncbi:MAG: nuclear transport factor 2 family protein [Campylobacterales bacterium]